MIEKLKSKNYDIPLLNFFKQLFLVIKAKELFKSRSVFRSINKLHDYHINLVNDLTFYKKCQNDKKFHKTYFIRSVIKKAMKKKLKKFLKSVKNLLG